MLYDIKKASPKELAFLFYRNTGIQFLLGFGNLSFQLGRSAYEGAERMRNLNHVRASSVLF